jgi:hypothetical protein
MSEPTTPRLAVGKTCERPLDCRRAQLERLGDQSAEGAVVGLEPSPNGL